MILLFTTYLTFLSLFRSTHLTNAALSATGTYSVANGDITIKITIPDTVTEEEDPQVTIFMSGPLDLWFAIAFDATKMSHGSYSIEINSNNNDNDDINVYERYLSAWAPGSDLSTSMITVISHIIDYDTNKHNITMVRNRIGLNSQYYTFPSGSNSDTNGINTIDLNIMYAMGTSNDFGYHFGNRGDSILTFIYYIDELTTTTVNPTQIPTIEPSLTPTMRPSLNPTMNPNTIAPTMNPSTGMPTVFVPNRTDIPTIMPSVGPSMAPTISTTYVSTDIITSSAVTTEETTQVDTTTTTQDTAMQTTQQTSMVVSSTVESSSEEVSTDKDRNENKNENEFGIFGLTRLESYILIGVIVIMGIIAVYYFIILFCCCFGNKIDKNENSASANSANSVSNEMINKKTTILQLKTDSSEISNYSNSGLKKPNRKDFNQISSVSYIPKTTTTTTPGSVASNVSNVSNVSVRSGTGIGGIGGGGLSSFENENNSNNNGELSVEISENSDENTENIAFINNNNGNNARNKQKIVEIDD